MLMRVVVNAFHIVEKERAAEERIADPTSWWR
jgi:hypothetical protein